MTADRLRDPVAARSAVTACRFEQRGEEDVGAGALRIDLERYVDRAMKPNLIVFNGPLNHERGQCGRIKSTFAARRSWRVSHVDHRLS